MEENMQPQQTAPKGKSLEKSILLTMLILFVTIVLFAGQTYAYFVASVSANENQIQAGYLDIELIQIQEDDQGQTDHVSAPLRMMPGTSVQQGDLVVQNAGTLPVYVRIKVVTTILESEHTISDGWETLISCNFKVREINADYNWVCHDGYYYYMSPVAPGEKTTPLFDTVIFSPAMGNEFMNSKIQFEVICQSVQAGGNHEDPLQAWGWPEDGAASE